MNASEAQLAALAPLGIAALSALVLVAADALFMKPGAEASERPAGAIKLWSLAALAGSFLLAALVLAGLNLDLASIGSANRIIATPNSMLGVDLAANLAMALLCSGGLLILCFSAVSAPDSAVHHGEFYPLLLLSITGALALVCAGNTISLFVAIELMSLPVYALTGFERDRARSNANGMQALLTGAFSSALTLYGIALVYGATGHFDYPGIRLAIEAGSPLALAGMALMLVGILARMGAAPFHRLLPDLAEGTPAVVAAFIATLVVTASAFALIRIFAALALAALPGFATLLELLSATSMVVGGFMALIQTSIKRTLAYAGVAHAGFVLAALATATTAGRSAAMFQVTAFAFMQLGALGTLAAISRNEAEGGDLTGLAERRPFLAAALTLFLLALAGMPGTSGFVSRLVVMSAAIDAGQIGLTLLMGITSVALFAACLRAPTAMYMETAAVATSKPAQSPLPAVIALASCAFVTLYLGFFPGQGPLPIEMLELVRRAALP